LHLRQISLQRAVGAVLAKNFGAVTDCGVLLNALLPRLACRAHGGHQPDNVWRPLTVV